MRPSIMFVYNADGGLFNTVADIAHKIFSPETYQCSLCAVTYGAFGMRREWKEFLESLDADLSFLHRDEFRERFPEVAADLPAVFRMEGGVPQLLVSAAEIGGADGLSGLERLILERMGGRR